MGADPPSMLSHSQKPPPSLKSHPSWATAKRQPHVSRHPHLPEPEPEPCHERNPHPGHAHNPNRSNKPKLKPKPQFCEVPSSEPPTPLTSYTHDPSLRLQMQRRRNAGRRRWSPSGAFLTSPSHVLFTRPLHTSSSHLLFTAPSSHLSFTPLFIPPYTSPSCTAFSARLPLITNYSPSSLPSPNQLTSSPLSPATRLNPHPYPHAQVG